LKKATYVLFLIFLIFSMPLFARGNIDEADAKTQNDEWFLCITKLDAASLPADKANISDVISRDLMDRLSSISYRTRISPEYAYYEEYAWARERAATAKSISSKMEERSKLIYQGEANWKYSQSVKKLDIDIKKLRENLDEIDKNAPLINKEPAFKLVSGNNDLSFPEPPAKGGERRFCVAQKSDAFLTGHITDFHGRYSLTLKLFTLYTRSYVWEDNFIFSYNDINATIEEITRKLMILLSGNDPSVITIRTEPETALLLINQSFAGRGEISSMEYPPGKVTINASAPDHESIVLETELLSGELTQINIKLNPIKYVNTDISSKTQGHVYHGSLYIGESPLTLRLPANNLEYVEITEDRGKRGSAAFKTKDNIDYNQTISFKLTQPNKRGAVDRQRRDYYWAWGGQWLSGIVAWIGYYSAMETANAINHVRNTGSDVGSDFLNTHNKYQRIYNGAAIAFGVTSLYGIIRMITYIYVSGRDSTPIVNTGRSK